MLLNKHFGYDEEDGMGIDGSLFQQELLALDQMGKKRIQVWINSPGGAVLDGYNICNAILKSNTRVDTYCIGMAASMAGVAFQCGRKRIMSDYGFLMYHNPYAGDTTESPMLNSMKSSLNKIIEQRSGMSTDAVQRMMDRTSFIECMEASNLKLCDEVESTVSMNTKNFPKEARAFTREANKVLNKLFNKSDMPLLKVTAKLKLNDDANEDSIVKGIDDVVNTAVASATAVVNKKSVEDLAKMKADLDDSAAKLAASKAEYDKAKTELDTANNKIKDAVDKALEVEAKALVETAVNEGKIKNETKVITEMVAKAKADMPGTKAIIDAIPVNKTSAKFKVINKEEKEVVYNAAVELAKISAKMDEKK